MKIPEKPPSIQNLIRTRMTDPGTMSRILDVGPVFRGRYEPWERIKYMPLPEGVELDDVWLGMKLARAHLLKPIPLIDKSREAFRFATPDHILKLLHTIDQSASGHIEIAEEVTNPATRDRYVISSLIEESITSSQLEGASTTVDVAKKMIRSGRKPTDRSEQMIFNNYHAMQQVRERRNESLTPELVFDLHRVLTQEAIDDPRKVGTFRTDADDIIVERRGTIVHVPPPAGELPERLARMCAFANDRPADVFIHPVVRAIAIHFWLAYDHPFVDGNGRTARALFYWSMLSQGYWLAEYLSISRILKQAPAQYARSFLLTETDDNDLTYFLEYHLQVICRSIDELQQFLRRKITEVRAVEAILRDKEELNHRQLAILSHALKHPGQRYTIESHRRSHNVVYQTARMDLLDLVEHGLMEQLKRGKTYVFSVPADIAERLQLGRRTGRVASPPPG